MKSEDRRKRDFYIPFPPSFFRLSPPPTGYNSLTANFHSSFFRLHSSAFPLPPFLTMLPLRDRTKAFALRIVKLYTVLPKTTEAQVLGKQVLRSGTSVGAHYRESTRARSDAEYVSKIEVGLQELEETIYWLELLAEAEIVKPSNLESLIHEAEELIAIFVTLAKKGKNKNKV